MILLEALSSSFINPSVKPFEPADLAKIRTYSLKERRSISSREAMGSPVGSGDSIETLLKSLPKSYMAASLLEVAREMQATKARSARIHFSLGSHVIKNGLSRYFIDWMEKGMIQAISFNGSAIIHDFELAYCGHTSENVDASIDSGQFGLARETATNIFEAISKSSGVGLAEAVGQYILKNTPYANDSLLAQAALLGIPATVHVAIGTDILHMHPGFDPEKTARASYNDFLKFIASVSKLEGGMYFNVGSAVILPEVFLKAVSVARNLGHSVEKFWAINIDFIRQYRPRRNVLERPTKKGGRAIEIIGPHEILIPLLHAATQSHIP